MGYSGQTFGLPCYDMGYNANPNVDNIPPNSMVSPTRNVNLHEGGIGKRGGTSHLDNAAMSGSPVVMGLHDFTLNNGTQYIIRTTTDGKIYKDNTTTIKTGLSNGKYTSFSNLNNTLYMANGNDAVQVWDGGAISDLANPSSDWTSTDQPSQLIVHGRGNSERMWALGVTGKPNFLYYSKDNDGSSEADFVNTGSGQFYIETGDGYGLTGMVEFQDRLIVFSKRNSFVIQDSDATPANWGYISSGWTGGASHSRLICLTPNDIIAMMDDGEIYSVRSVQEYGDYKAASISRPAYIHNYIKNYVDLSYINKFHMIFDPVLRCINIYVVRQGQTTVDTALVYFIDRPIDKAWSIKDNQSYDSGWSASCAALVKESSNYRVYTGDYDGFVWKTETANYNDNSNGYYAGFKTPYLTFGNARLTKRYDALRVIMKPTGLFNLSASISIDGSQSMTGLISMAGTGGAVGSFILGTDVLGGNDLLDKELSIGDKGKRIQVELYNSTADQNFFISQVQFDFKPLGAQP